MLGTFILWFGWYGFNPGSALILTTTNDAGRVASIAAVNTTLSAASAAVSALFTHLLIEERTTGEAKFDLVMAMNGAISGLVAVTSGCAVLEPWAAVVVGTIAGWLYLLTSSLLLKLRIDDAVDAIPVHLTSGTWGIIATGFFASPSRMLLTYGHARHFGWFYSLSHGSFDANLLAAQLLCVIFILGWVFVLMFPFFIWLNYMGWFRADSLEELVGLDVSYHGGGGSHNDEVKMEYIDAYNKKKGRFSKEVTEGEEDEDFDDQGDFDAHVQPYRNGQPYNQGQPYDQGQSYDQGQQYDQGGQGDYNQGYDEQGYDGQGFPPEAQNYSEQGLPAQQYRNPEPPVPGYHGGLPASFHR